LSALKIIANKYEKTRYERQKNAINDEKRNQRKGIGDSEKLIPFLLRLFLSQLEHKEAFLKKVRSEKNSPRFFQ
jgi:hypothetical protein